ncbi:fruit-body specific protein a [Favolaschia claudopus]|uniref:Fruit-body specific protein a n=1 Tax=Favolaschia claudopus TaxID=2862362 RepID=A0AAW0ATQ5_9AGAR
MHFNILLSALYLFTVGVSAAAPSAGSKASQSVGSLNAGNNYGAPIPPWQPGAQPGWYYGNPQKAPSGLICLVDNVRSFLPLLPLRMALPQRPRAHPQLVLHLLRMALPRPHPPPPPPPPGYTYTYDNFTCATEVWPISYYISFGKVETMEGNSLFPPSSKKMRAQINAYHDNNAGAGKDFTELLTCSLFKIVTDKKNATNCGGQQQQNKPVGTTFITDSYGLKRT